MWRCPRCVAHVRDDLTDCPVCQTPAPERSVAPPAEGQADLDDPSRKTDRVSLIPNLSDRNLEETTPRQLGNCGFFVGCVIGFVGGTFGFLKGNVSGWEYIIAIPVALMLGVIGGLFMGVVLYALFACAGHFSSAFVNLYEGQPTPVPRTPDKDEVDAAERVNSTDDRFLESDRLPKPTPHIQEPPAP